MNTLKKNNYEEIKEEQFTFGDISGKRLKLFCLKISINRVFRYGYNGYQISNSELYNCSNGQKGGHFKVTVSDQVLHAPYYFPGWEW